MPFRRAVPVPLAVLAVLLPLAMAAKDREFTGLLQRITNDSITILRSDGTLLDAGLPKAGDLSAARIIARYNFADQVQLTRKANQELKSLSLLRHPSKEESEQVMDSIAWRKEENLLKTPPRTAGSAGGPTGGRQAELELARRVSLERVVNMPNFVVDETAKRYTSPNINSPVWKPLDTITSEVTFQKGDPTRQHVRINGKPWNRPDFPIFTFGVDFGTDLKNLFDPDCGNSFEFLGREEANGKHLLAFGFRSPAFSCFGYWSNGGVRYIPKRAGRILVEDRTGNVVRYELEAMDIHKEFQLSSWKDTEIWDEVKIGDASYWLPVAFESVLGFGPGNLTRVQVTYTNPRHFESSTNIDFH